MRYVIAGEILRWALRVRRRRAYRTRYRRRIMQESFPAFLTAAREAHRADVRVRLHGRREIDALREWFDRDLRKPLDGQLGPLGGIPVIIDTEVPEGRMRLVAADGTILAEVNVR